MTGFDIQLWNRVLEQVKDLDLCVEVSGDRIRLFDSGHGLMGFFDTGEAIYEYLCGYDTGFAIGRLSGLAEVSNDPTDKIIILKSKIKFPTKCFGCPAFSSCETKRVIVESICPVHCFSRVSVDLKECRKEYIRYLTHLSTGRKNE